MGKLFPAARDKLSRLPVCAVRQGFAKTPAYRQVGVPFRTGIDSALKLKIQTVRKHNLPILPGRQSV